MTENDRWIGVVEDRKDFAGTGRLKVRIVGIHPQDVSQVPTSSLPDAQTERSVATAHLFSGPREGDWVTGYFINGDRQHPMVTGVSNGLRGADVRVPNPNANVIRRAVNTRLFNDSAQLDALTRQFNLLSIRPSGKGLLEIAKLSLQINLKRQSVFNLSQLRNNLDTVYNTRVQYGFIDNRSIAEINSGASVPAAWNKLKAQDYLAGYPTVPQYARGITVGSANAYSVRNRAHVCDIAMQVRQALGKSHFAVAFFAAIREGIQTFLQGLGTSPFAAKIADKAMKLANDIRLVTYYLKEANRFINDVIVQLQILQALIAFIKRLPAYLKALFNRCMQEAYREIAAYVFDLVSSAFPDADPGTSAVFQAVGEVVNATSELLTEANKTKALADKLTYTLNTDNPSPYTDADALNIIKLEFPDTYDKIKTKVLSPII
jgi:hypothetical protein